MSWQMHDREFDSVLSLSAHDRYEYFLKRVADREQVWRLRNDDGWVMVGDDRGREMIPFWPHERFAAACAVDGWHGAVPEAIALANWMDDWLPGMATDGVLVAVFPTPAGQGIVAEPEGLKNDLAEELLQYE